MKKSWLRKYIGTIALAGAVGVGTFAAPKTFAGVTVGVGINVPVPVIPVPSAEIEVNGPPPPLQVETVPVSPGPDFVWIPGAWTWGDGRWVWEKGRYNRPPHPGMTYTPHRYYDNGGKHKFVRGGWH